MRQKERRIVVTFACDTDVMRAREYFKTEGIDGRLISMPGAITSSCGMAWSSPMSEEERLLDLLKRRVVKADGWYEIEV